MLYGFPLKTGSIEKHIWKYLVKQSLGIHSFNRYLMSTYYVLDTAHNKFFKNLCIHRAYILVEGKKKTFK